MEKAYDALFNTKDPEDAAWCRLIPSLNFSQVRECLEQTVHKVNSRVWKSNERHRYATDLTRHQQHWDEIVFHWTTDSSYPTLTIDYTVLQERSRRGFVVWMCLSGCWMGGKQGLELPSFWSLFETKDDTST
jgi:hypothetical protein